MILQHPRWADQPEFEQFNGLLDLALDGFLMVQVAEVVYKGEDGIIVSAGNLFSSQTIMVQDYRDAFRAIDFLTDACYAMDHKCLGDEWRKKYMAEAQMNGWNWLPNKEKENGKA